VGPPPASPTSYFFHLGGDYVARKDTVSLAKRIQIDVAYEEIEIAPLCEGSLLVYRFDTLGDTWKRLVDPYIGKEWRVDTAKNVVHIDTRRIGDLGIGGYVSQLYMPLVQHEAEARLAGVDGREE